VITVTLNSREFLAHCMQSVFDQTGGDFEYVVIDGGSHDGTREIIEERADRLAYWHSRPDRGLGHAFNLGVQHSRGEWFLFLNADDYFVDSSALRRLIEAIRLAGDADVVFGQIDVVTRSQTPKKRRGPVGWPVRSGSFLLRQPIPHPAALTRRAYYERVGPFCEDFRIAVDYEFFVRDLARLRAHFVPTRVACMREGGLSGNVQDSLREAYRAQRKHHLAPAMLLAALYFLLCVKAAAGRLRRMFM
jgi:glycosyltransferase involved in cell wall biosynthesis